MLGRYLVFCIGAALLQAAFVKQPDALDIRLGRVGHSPEAFLNLGVRSLVMGLAIISLVIEVAVGLVLFGWWPGLFLWMPALVVMGVLVPSRNPAPPFFIGLVVAVAAGVSLLF
jgi:hypothetical protein